MKIEYIFIFFFLKIKSRLIKFIYSRYNKFNYPNYIKVLKNDLNFYSLKVNFFKKKKKIISLKKIELATTLIDVKFKINWKKFTLKYFKDQEDYESLHRWKWVIKYLSQNRLSKENFFWIESQLIEWDNIFGNLNEKNNLVWESYNVSERVSNLILLSKLTNFDFNENVHVILFKHIKYLIDNLEFFGINTGNHIINNSRALILFGIFYNNKKTLKLGYLILKNEIKKMLDKNFMLAEGSTHYHFLVQSWLLEIYYFLQNSKKVNYRYLKFILKKINEVSFFFKKDLNQIPLFGDISPDCTPAWLANIEKSSFYQNEKNPNKGTWNYIWKYKFIKKIHKINKSKLILLNSGYIKLKLNDHLIILRVQPTYDYKSFYLLNHGHDDIGHILYFYKKIPIIVDSGRYTYKNNLEKKSSFHNSLNSMSLLRNLDFNILYCLNFLLLKCIFKVKANKKFINLIFIKKTNFFTRFFLNLERKIEIQKNEINICDLIKNQNLLSEILITFSPFIRFKLEKNRVFDNILYIKKSSSYKILIGKRLSPGWFVTRYGIRKKTKYLKAVVDSKNIKELNLNLRWEN